MMLDRYVVESCQCVCLLSMQGIYYSLQSFLDKPEYCNAIDISPGISGKTFIVQVYVLYNMEGIYTLHIHTKHCVELNWICSMQP